MGNGHGADGRRQAVADVDEVGERSLGPAAEEGGEARPRPGQIHEQPLAEPGEGEGDRGGARAALRGKTATTRPAGALAGWPAVAVASTSASPSADGTAGSASTARAPAPSARRYVSTSTDRASTTAGGRTPRRAGAGRGRRPPRVGDEGDIARGQPPGDRPQRSDDADQLDAGEIIRERRHLGSQHRVCGHHQAADDRCDHSGHPARAPPAEARPAPPRRSPPLPRAAVGAGSRPIRRRSGSPRRRRRPPGRAGSGHPAPAA